MRKPMLEVEVKFYLQDLAAYERQLLEIGAVPIRPRTREVNYRFDTPELTLTRDRRVLRLRQDTSIILTYKGPAQPNDAVSVRPEIEVEVNDFLSASNLLEELGYSVSVKYEKWRSIYHLKELEITLDEMPFGNFTEIEGGTPEILQQTAALLGLNWESRITDSYLLLFDRVKTNLILDLPDLTFEAFKALTITPGNLGVIAADASKN